jgi:hypothetical protein
MHEASNTMFQAGVDHMAYAVDVGSDELFSGAVVAGFGGTMIDELAAISGSVDGKRVFNTALNDFDAEFFEGYCCASISVSDEYANLIIGFRQGPRQTPANEPRGTSN